MGDKDPFNERIGLQVRQLRESRGIVGAEIERRTGGSVTKATLSKLEAGKQGWLPKYLVAVAGALGVDPRDLLPGPEPSGAPAPPASAAAPRENPAPALPPAKQALLDAVDDAGPEALAAAARVLARALEAARG